MRLLRLARIFTVVWRYRLDEIVVSSLQESDAGPLRALDHVRRPARHARRTAATGAGGSRSDLREVRPGAVDTPRPAAARCRRRTRQAAGPCAALSVGRGDARDRARARAADRRRVRGFRATSRWPRPRSRRCTSRSLKDGPHAGKEVAVKVLRPNMLSAIDKDLSLLETGATLVEKLWRDGKRLRPRDVVREFDTYLHDELDLNREAANASQLRRNFAGSPLLVVPEMYFDYCADNVLVMERMHGIPVSQIDRLKRGRHRPQEAVARRRDAVLHAGVRPRVLPRRHAPRQHPGRHQRRPVQQVHRARLRHRRHADRDRQELPGAEFPRVLPARLQAHRGAARRIRLGAGRHAHQRAGRRRCAPSSSRCSTSR